MSDSAISPRSITVRAPTRIDLGGGWTDVPPYCEEQGGFVCNIAITRYATATVNASVNADETYPQTDAPADLLITAVLKRMGAPRARVTLTSDYPVGAGLGGSSAASAALLGALHSWKRLPWDRAAIAEDGRRIEVEELGIAGGRQDHYAATHGGVLGLTFTGSVRVKRLAVTNDTLAALERRALLLYTGESRVSGATIRGVLDAYRNGDAGVCSALAAMKTLARGMADSLQHGDLDALGAQLAEHWLYQRSLHPTIPTPRIDEIVMCAREAGATGWKAMGASGGGCVLVLAGEDRVAGVRAALAHLGSFIDWSVDREGMAVVA